MVAVNLRIIAWANLTLHKFGYFAKFTKNQPLPFSRKFSRLYAHLKVAGFTGLKFKDGI